MMRNSDEQDNLDMVGRYDSIMFDPKCVAYFGGSDFTNFGYWEPETVDQRQACANLMERLIELIPHKRGTILDVACGKGGTTRHLLKHYRAADITAINVSARQLARAQEIAPGCDFHLMDACHLALADNSVDNMICVEAAFHFDTRERFLKEARRVLKPGGCLVLSDILMTRQAERSKPYRLEANYLSGPAAYQELCRRVGFARAEVIDATQQCWVGCFWHAVRYIHERYFARQVGLPALKDFLALTYRRAADIRYYVLAVCHKRVER